VGRFTVRGIDKLKFADERLKPAVQRMGESMATMIHDRVAIQGRDATGRRLPPVANRTGWWWTGVTDPRFKTLKGEFIFQRPKGSQGAPTSATRYVFPRGYRALKQRLGQRTHRGAPLTGHMWKNMTVVFLRGKKGGVKTRIYFAKSQKIGKSATERTATGRAKTVSVRNRTKAKMLQYKNRDGRGRPTNRVFTLMQPTALEIGLAKQILITNIRFRQRQ